MLDFNRIQLTTSSATSIIGSFLVIAVFIGVVIIRRGAQVIERVRRKGIPIIKLL